MNIIDKAAEVIYTAGDLWRGEARRLAQALHDAGLLAPEPHVVGSVETERYSVINGWLVEAVDGCTCAAPPEYGHETGCGHEPIAKIEDLLTPTRPPALPTREQVIDALVMTRFSDYAGTDMRLVEQAANAIMALLNEGAE